MDRWVINASPLICLAKAGYADLLLKLQGEAVIPQAVVDEIQIDDRAARKCALSFSIPFKGTLAVVILAKKRGLISSAAEVMRALQTAGLRLEDDVIRAALQHSAGEDWEP
jgi:predicted nucleic acid-binding protein